MKSLTVLLGAMASGCWMLAAPIAMADEEAGLAPRANSWFAQNGLVSIGYAKESKVYVNGALAAGVEANPRDDQTMSNSIGYNFTPNISTQLVLGVFAETSVLNQAGAKLGSMEYGAPSIVFDYRWTNMGAFQPFAGIGGMYIFVKDEEDAALRNLKVDNTFGLILRAGAEVMLSSQFGFYAAANKILFADTEATGFLGANAVKADLELDPWIYQGGFTFRY